jgi:ribosomal protein L37AE/L43A
MDKDHKHGYEKTYEDSEKTMKRSSCSLSSDEDDAKDEVSVQESTHQCNVCGKTFSNGKALGGHRRSHFLKKKLNHRSQKVQTPLSIQGSYNRASFDKDSKHGFENTREESEKRIKRSFSSLSSDEDDAKDELSIQETTHQCNVCGKTFSKIKALGGHRRSHFLKQKLHHDSQKVDTPFSIQGNNTMASLDKDHKHDHEDTYEESEKRVKRSACSLSSDEDDAKDEVSVQESTHQC